ncbi:MAG: CHAT domain-containing protein [Cyanobacteria bacterium P01_A01_bin.68]
MYVSALATVEEIQDNTLSVNHSIKFSFKDDIEPLYQEYLELILSVKKPDFKKAIQVKEDLQLAEIKNFLQCGNLPLFNIEGKENQTSISSIIYIFKFKNRVDILVKKKNQIVVHKTQNLSEVIYSIDNLMNITRSADFLTFSEDSFLIASQNLYELLLAPIKDYLPKDGSLRFVLDTYFQNIPFSLMNDEENYLIEKYDISTSLTSKFLEPVFLKPEDLNVFFAGISQLNPNLKTLNTSNGFSPLPEVETELLNIKSSANDTLELMNKEFTSRKFQQLATKTDFPAIHISSHGQFSSDPKKTFILAWDKPINVRELEYLVKIHDQKNSDPIDLLILSACETAKGDKRSALGIAGVTVMAGAKTSLASLWLVDSESTALLMGYFYDGLKKGLNESQALREAQLTLSKNPKYSHPYYWAPFILVGR